MTYRPYLEGRRCLGIDTTYDIMMHDLYFMYQFFNVFVIIISYTVRH